MCQTTGSFEKVPTDMDKITVFQIKHYEAVSIPVIVHFAANSTTVLKETFQIDLFLSDV